MGRDFISLKKTTLCEQMDVLLNVHIAEAYECSNKCHSGLFHSTNILCVIFHLILGQQF